ncbi:MAG: helix-turn-helix domain-containing protein [Bacteroidales bacterium]|nr:helix-turn-helix domain-containing protein [Bacteroidales bacterium]
MQQTENTTQMALNLNWFDAVSKNIQIMVNELRMLKTEMIDVKNFISSLDSELLTEKEVETKLKLKRTSLYFLRQKGILHTFGDGRNLKYSKSEVENYMKQQNQNL